MLDRILIFLAIVAIGVTLYRVYTARRLRHATQSAPADPLLADAPRGVPTVVYFTAPTCAPCQLQVTPMLRRLQAEYGDGLHIVRVDATQDPDAASRWGVLTVPTTFVFDADGQARAAYNGVFTEHQIKRELGLSSDSQAA